MNEFFYENNEIIRYALIGLLFVSVFMILISKVLNPLISKSIGAVKKLNLVALTHTRKRYIQDYLPCKLTVKLDETYKYSRLYRTALGKFFSTSASYFFFSLIASSLISFILVLVFGDVTLFFAMPFLFCVPYIILYGMRVYNGHRVSEQLVTFLNLLGNYSTTNTEVISVLAQTARHLSEPLSSCLVECVAEAQSDISTEKALMNLSNKIEPIKFKEIIKSVMMAQRYSDGFSSTVNFSRENLNAQQKQIKEKRSLVKTNIFTLIACFVGLVGVMFVVSRMLDIDIAYNLLHTMSGRIVALVAVSVLLFFGMELVSAYKD